MSNFVLLDVFARGGTLALLALWTAILLRDYRQALAARLAVAMNIAIAAHVIVTIRTVGLPPSLAMTLDLISAMVPALFWLFARAWFNDEERIGWTGWTSLPLTLALHIAVLATYDIGGVAHQIGMAAMRVAMFSFALAGLWVAWRGRESDLVEARRKLRWRLVWSVGLFVLLTNAVEVLVRSGSLGDWWRSLVEMGIAVLTLFLCVAMFGTRQDGLLAAPRRGEPEPGNAQPIDEALAARLRDFLATERPWRDESLTIAGLAARLGEQEYRLRRLINRSLGHRNFAQFLNSYRLEEVKAALADPVQREVPILTIALDAGFGSLGPFNRAFREAEGMTPSQYRARALADSGIG